MDSSKILDAFKRKVVAAFKLVDMLDDEEKLKAVRFWNSMSKRVQELFGQPEDYFNSFALQLDEGKIYDYIATSEVVPMDVVSPLSSYIDTNVTEVVQESTKTEQTEKSSHSTLSAVVIPATSKAKKSFHNLGKHVKDEMFENVCSQFDIGTESVITALTDEFNENSDNMYSDVSTAVVGTNGGQQTVHLMIAADSVVDMDLTQNCIKSDGKVKPEKKESPFKCETCDRTFRTIAKLVAHQHTHNDEKRYYCPLCPSNFGLKGNLHRHIKSHSGEKPWKCMECGSCFTAKKSLTIHMRRHTGERPYKCTLCSKSFSQSGVLSSHMAMHMDRRDYRCAICGHCCRQKSQLRQHEERHRGVRKFTCEVCNFKFVAKGDYERHKKIHSSERPFACELCGKQFARQQSLNEHLNRHYDIKPYTCTHCKKGFSEMSACYKHIKLHERKPDPGDSQQNDEPSYEIVDQPESEETEETDSKEYMLVFQD